MMLRIAVMAALCAGAAAGGEGDLSAPVAVLTDHNFQTALDDSSKRVWMIEFYAPWCAHCKALAPVYEEAAKKVTGMRFAKIDATTHKLYAGQFKVTGYPSLFWVRDGKHRRYRGSHKLEGFAQLAATLASPAVKDYSSDAEFRAFAAQADVVFALSNAEGSACSADQRGAFDEAARQLQDELKFGNVVASGAIQGAGESCAVARIEDGEEPQLLQASVLDADAIVKFCESNKFQRVIALSSKTFWAASHAGRKLVAAIVDGVGSATAGTLRDELRRLARPGSALGKEPSADFLFGVMDGAEKNEDGKSLVGEFLSGYGVDVKRDLPAVVVFDISERSSERYYSEGVSQPSDVQAFLEGVLSGAVHPQYQGIWGKPERIWRSVKKVVPALAPLDVLPPFSFVIPGGLLFFFGLLRCLCFGDDEYEYEEEDAKKTD